jgi:Protein of unknown function (DUF1552)
MTSSLRISRRTVLRGLGVAVALPLLEAMEPVSALAAGATRRAFPKRMAVVYVPNGVNMRKWTPEGTGTRFQLPSVLEPLAPYKSDLMVLSGLTCDKARPHGDGGGDHARAMSAFLTGRQPRKTDGANIRAGISVDQLAASRVGMATRFASLEIGCEGGRQSGNCDSGYSCAYSSSISWRGEATPVPKEINPRLVFDRLFGGSNRGETQQSQARRDRYNQSILDFVSDDVSQLRARLGLNDQRRMDEYLTALRDLERRIVHSTRVELPGGQAATRPVGIPGDYQEHIRLLTDLLVLAFQTDATRVATFVFANEGSNRSYRHINVPEGHHDLSHHAGNVEKLDKIRRINRFHITQYAYLLDKLRSVREGDGTLLDNCMILYGSGNSDGNRHNHDNLPILLAGKGGGTLATGRHVVYPRETPITNLYLSLLERMGVQMDSFGDSTGRLTNLS